MKGELHRVAELARTMPPVLPMAAELRDVPPALRSPHAEVLAEIIWPDQRPLRVPSIGSRS
jgi:hypothetical protein